MKVFLVQDNIPMERSSFSQKNCILAFEKLKQIWVTTQKVVGSNPGTVKEAGVGPFKKTHTNCCT